ncbi:hypothetical protein GCM10007301_35980 [Azorhizobium oxalatiphilum]|uniref:Uncharacterized protein n=1 Tax=Azorhizobium oxalatiphilum TaxID=980631 RepID=A0A917C5L6_9HYPH|nr:hypothetical protein [Azorhizobium oxalatiphilum]GGF72986.1 hypothetical protein GCM10007301_35980 [Azorhizobium oxalatiphilum]
MQLNADVRLMRRYVISRAAGRAIPEWTYFVPQLAEGMGAWLRGDEKTAKATEHWRRERRPSEPWCPWLGRRCGVLEDMALQAFFMTVPEDGWSRLDVAVSRTPSRCFREWRASGERLLAFIEESIDAPPNPGPAAGWPAKRGVGMRSLLALR